nr:hypothetical protein SHINE37_70185 [Rhizobiaceae bacterium]
MAIPGPENARTRIAASKCFIVSLFLINALSGGTMARSPDERLKQRWGGLQQTDSIGR